MEIPPKLKEYIDINRGSLPPITDPEEPLQIDSLGLIEFLETEFGYQIEDEELIAENFATQRKLGEFLATKTPSALTAQVKIPPKGNDAIQRHIMMSKALIIAALLTSALASVSGQGSVPIATPNATETFAIVTDGFNPDFQLKWDVYLPPTAGRYPAVLVIFGGEFKDGDRSEVGGIAAYLASQGFVALAIDYRVDQPNTRTGQQFPVYAPPAVPNQPGDVKLAVTAARTGVIPSGSSTIRNWITGKVGAVGGSSGASHALWCAATGTLSTDKLDAAVLFSGAYKFDDPASLTWPGDRRCTYGGGLNFCSDVYRYCHLDPNSNCSATPAPELQAGSPIYQVGADVSPLFWVSDAGDLITPYQFSDLVNSLESFDADPPVFKSVWLTARRDECNHSFDNWPAEQGDVVTWLHARLDASP